MSDELNRAVPRRTIASQSGEVPPPGEVNVELKVAPSQQCRRSRSSLATPRIAPPMAAKPVALIPQCEECDRVWLPNDTERWRCYLDDEDNLVFYRPDCAEREFGDD